MWSYSALVFVLIRSFMTKRPCSAELLASMETKTPNGRCWNEPQGKSLTPASTPAYRTRHSLQRFQHKTA
ncbi:hypothetical protein CHARACLAT_014131 [Characodon lateralis]|uniref:Secreted protein n=1 Tax=Characodon lateralis TaxID=208331 RepID=A0ABU7D0I4_9TELE|nr:hypothetical protein [Characodon lateralis]